MSHGFAGLPAVQLNPGELVVAHEATLLITILGSCVAVAFWHARTRLAALCHGVMPGPGRQGVDERSFRYVEPAIVYMLERFLAARVRRDEIRVKLFGGGEVIAAPPDLPRRVPSVGSLNVAAARAVLERERLSIVAEDVGGFRGRKILFDTRTGEVLLRRLSKPGPGVRRAPG